VPFPRPDRSAPADREVSEAGIVIAVGDVDAGRIVYEALRNHSERVTLVSSATEALALLNSLSPALLVVDDELPLVRGLDLAGRTRSERSDVDIILLTEDDAIISLIGRLRVERIHCIKKPFNLEKLRQAVGISLQALAQLDAGLSYAELVAELEDQKSRFERRIKNLERKRSAPRSPPPEPAPPSSAATSSRPLPADLHLLVVDDDPLVRRAMARSLSKHHVTLAENGLAATREIERSRPDVIVSDLRMPEMDGLALAEEVKRRWPDLADRIVFVSGTGSQIERASVEAPSQQVLRKPIEGAALEERIAEVLEKAMHSQRR
jgi:CheY-like chemotaxis protein